MAGAAICGFSAYLATATESSASATLFFRPITDTPTVIEASTPVAGAKATAATDTPAPEAGTVLVVKAPAPTIVPGAGPVAAPHQLWRRSTPTAVLTFRALPVMFLNQAVTVPPNTLRA